MTVKLNFILSVSRDKLSLLKITKLTNQQVFLAKYLYKVLKSLMSRFIKSDVMQKAMTPKISLTLRLVILPAMLVPQRLS